MRWNGRKSCQDSGEITSIPEMDQKGDETAKKPKKTKTKKKKQKQKQKTTFEEIVRLESVVSELILKIDVVKAEKEICFVFFIGV